MMKKLGDLRTPEDFAQHWLDVTYESPGVKFYLVELFERHAKLVQGLPEPAVYLNGTPVCNHIGKEL